RLEAPREGRPLAVVMASMDAMSGREFEENGAELLRRGLSSEWLWSVVGGDVEYPSVIMIW
ncbi:hypothetical protein AB0959_52970, partial [Streptomyces sp. NPDC046862]